MMGGKERPSRAPAHEEFGGKGRGEELDGEASRVCACLSIHQPVHVSVHPSSCYPVATMGQALGTH